MNSNCLYMKKFNLITGKMEVHGTIKDKQLEYEKDGFIVATIAEFRKFCKGKL